MPSLTPRIEVVAHRGASSDEPEHSLAAYLLAIEQGADAIECDVRLTADGNLVCVHDRRVDRTSNGRGTVSGQTLAQLSAFDYSRNDDTWLDFEDPHPDETRTSVLDTTEKQYDTVLAVNLKSAFFGTQLAAKQMIAQGTGGVVVNTSSVHEDWPMPGNTPYCLTKGGMRMLARTAGVELAPKGVRVVNVAPGAVATPINQVEMDPATLQRLDDYIPMGRMAKPEEIGSVIAFVASDGASYLTATTVFADGGIMMQSPGL